MNQIERFRRCGATTHKTGRSPLKCLEYACWVFGGLAISWFATALWSAHAFQHVEAEKLKVLENTSIRRRALQTGDVFGQISIPRLGMSAIIVEGVDDGTLRHAVGHFPESSTPEQLGTVALAGHRDSFFRGLARIRMRDELTLETAEGTYNYQVVHTFVVDPHHTKAIRNSPQSDLTLVTCFPFYFVGPAPQRFIVQARRIRSE